MLKIFPETEGYANITPKHRLSFCYLHGKLESDAGYDVFNIQHKSIDNLEDYYIPVGTFETGIYDSEFNGKLCTLYLWVNQLEDRKEHHGLCVYNDDKNAMEYALRKFNEKPHNI